MYGTFVIFDFDYLHGTSMVTSSTCITSVAYIHNWKNNSNFILIDCRCFCNLQEAIDIIERRVIPSDSDADFTTSCGEMSFSSIIGVVVYTYNKVLISDNSLFAELSLIVLIYLGQINQKLQERDLSSKSFTLTKLK